MAELPSTDPVPSSPEMTPSLSILRMENGAKLHYDGTLLSLTDVGARNNQEDLVLTVGTGSGCLKPRRLMAIDGMGGPANGEIAASVVANHFSINSRETGALYPVANAANNARYDLARKFHDHLKDPGAVFAVADIIGDQVELSNVGDARAYLIRKGKLIKLTGDNYKEPEQAEELEAFEARLRSCKSEFVSNAITAKGTHHPTDFHTQTATLQKGDILLLCTDGTHEAADSQTLMKIIGEEISRKANPTPWCERVLTRIKALQISAEIVDNFSLQVYCHGQSIETAFRENYPHLLVEPTTPILSTTAGSSYGVAAASGRAAYGVVSGPQQAGIPYAARASDEPAGVGCTVRGAVFAALLLAACGGTVKGCAALYDGLTPDPAPAFDPKALYAPVCANSIPGTWTLVSGPNKSSDMTTYKGHKVDVKVGTSANPDKVAFNDYPGTCLDGRAPRAVAAEHPTGKDVVKITDGATTKTYNFKPNGNTATQARNKAVTGDLDLTANGTTWLHCDAPISMGCTQDIAAMQKAVPKK